MKIGMDLGKKVADVCVMAEPDRVSERFQVAMKRTALQKQFGNRPKSQVALEAGRSAGWVYRELVALGHDVVMADTSRVRTIGVGQGRRKTDRRDAEALARALWAGVVPRAHVLSEKAARLRDVLHSRDQLVRQRTRLVTILRGQWQARGLDEPRCTAETFAEKLRATGAAEIQAVHVQALLGVLDAVQKQIAVFDAEMKRYAEREPVCDRLISAPGVGRVVALGYVAALDDAGRFRNAHEVEAYLGLVPSEWSTGGKTRPGGITKCGNPLARRLLVQAAQAVLRRRETAVDDPLTTWARQVAERRRRKVAVVALARRLAGILWALWRDGTFYEAKRVGRASADGLSRRAREASAHATAMRTATMLA